MILHGLSIEEFGFTEVSEDNIPYRVVGYAPGTCTGTTAFTPPVGWQVTSCTQMPPGSHGVVSAAQPVVLVFCSPIASVIAIDTITPAPEPFAEIGGIPGFILMGLTGIGLMGGYIYLASKNNKK